MCKLLETVGELYTVTVEEPVILASNEPSSRACAVFGEYREGQIPRPLGRKEQARSCPVACCGVFDYNFRDYNFREYCS